MSDSLINVSTGGDGQIEFKGDIVGGDKITGEVVNIQHNITEIHTKEKIIPRMAPAIPRVFTGRDDVTMDLLRAMRLRKQTEKPIPVVLSGMGGVGKTAIATILAHEKVVTDQLPDGVLWAQLGPDPDLMTWLATWGDQLGFDVSTYTDLDARSRALSTLLHGRRILIVLDDVWRESDAEHFWLTTPGARLIVTTRDTSVAENLAGAGQAPYVIPPLSSKLALNLLRTMAPEAVQADIDGTTRLVESLGGLPISLTLAGQMIAREWQAGLGIQGALEELMGNKGQAGLLQDEQDSLRAMLAVSYEHLPDDGSRRAFRQLGVFGGQPRSFSWEAAAEIWGKERRPAQRLIATLVDQQMIQPLGNGIYSLHNAFADFALTLLQEHGESDAMHERFVTHYLTLAQEKVESDWSAIENALPQIQKAFKSLIAQQDMETIATFLQTMNRFFTRRGLWQALAEWTEASLNVADAIEEKAICGQLNNNLAYLYYQKGEWQQALEYYAEGLKIFESLGDLHQQGITLSNMGSVYSAANWLDDALDQYEKSQEIFEKLQAWNQLASALNQTGSIYRRLDELETAESYHKLSLQLYEGLEDEAGIGRTLNQLGTVHDLLGETSDALDCYEKAHGIFVQKGNLVFEGVSLFNMAQLYRDEGRLAKAISAMERVVEIDIQLARPDLDQDKQILAELLAEQQNQGRDE